MAQVIFQFNLKFYLYYFATEHCYTCGNTNVMGIEYCLTCSRWVGDCLSCETDADSNKPRYPTWEDLEVPLRTTCSYCDMAGYFVNSNSILIIIYI